MPRFAITRQGNTPPLSDNGASDQNTSLNTTFSTPNTQDGVGDVFSSSSPSRKRAAEPTISSAAATTQKQGATGPSGTLYLVAVPIGCTEDISLRALRILRESALILCENIAAARSLTEHFDITTSLTRYSGQAGGQKNDLWLDRLLAGEDLAFVCDVGTPGIADPGQSLVCAALQRSVSVVAIPGPAAALVALVASGLSTERFAFDGFPPRIRADRDAFFSRLQREERTIVLYESAGALVSTLRALCAGGNQARRAAVACHLTHPVENWFRGTLQEAIGHFRQNRPRGEYTLVIEGSTKRTAI